MISLCHGVYYQDNVGRRMGNLARNVAILGATGSIGRNTLEVVEAARDRLQIVGLTANKSLSQLCSLARRYRPRWIVGTDASEAARFDWSGLPSETELLRG